MPEIGEIRSAKEFGLDPKTRHRRIYVRCPQCGKERWVGSACTKRPDFTGLCHECNASLRGGKHIKNGYRWVNSNGYILVKLQPTDFFYSMANKDGYVLEHRLVMAKQVGRNLHSWEIVHHKGIRLKGKRNRSDNLEDNLQLVSDDRHKQITILENKIGNLEKRVTLLEAENATLRGQISQEV